MDSFNVNVMFQTLRIRICLLIFCISITAFACQRNEESKMFIDESENTVEQSRNVSNADNQKSSKIEAPPSNTPVPVPTNTPTPAPTNTPVPVPTNTPTPPPTSTPTPAPTSTPIPIPTSTPTPTPTSTPTPIPVIIAIEVPELLTVNQNEVFDISGKVFASSNISNDVFVGSVDWGEGKGWVNVSVVQDTGEVIASHTYESAGSFIIKIRIKTESGGILERGIHVNSNAPSY